MARAAWLGFAALLLALFAARTRISSVFKFDTNSNVAVVPFFLQETSILNFTILATNDMHSAVTEAGPEALATAKRGGYARMTSLLNGIRNYLTVDAGDWYAGSLFDQLGPNINSTCVPELEYFHASHYDAINIGNHDFDATDRGLAHMFTKAQRKGLNLNFLSSNINIKSGPLLDFVGRQTPTSNVTLRPYTVKTFLSSLRPIRVGVLGLLGPDAALCSAGSRGPVSFVGFNDTELVLDPAKMHDNAQRLVAMMRDDEAVDFVVVLLHGGPEEARALAKNVPGIDIIASAHTHESYYHSVDSQTHDSGSPQQTHVVQCGHSGQTLGMMRFYVDASFKLHLAETPECMAVDASHHEDQNMQALIRGWKEELPNALNTSFSYEQVIYRGPDGYLFNSSHDYFQHARTVSSLLLSEVNLRLRSMGHVEADLYLTCPTCVRTRPQVQDGEVVLKYSDIYRMLSISTSCDMVVFHMRKEDLWTLINFVVILEKILSKKFVLTLGGVAYETGAWGLPFINYFRNLRLERADGSTLPYDQWPALIRVATSTYIGKHIWKAKRFSYGFIPTPARDSTGAEISMADSIVPFLPSEYKLLADHLYAHSAVASADPLAAVPDILGF